jgi:hypothetical protein
MRARLGRCMILDADSSITPNPSLTVSWPILGNSYLVQSLNVCYPVLCVLGNLGNPLRRLQFAGSTKCRGVRMFNKWDNPGKETGDVWTNDNFNGIATQPQ